MSCYVASNDNRFYVGLENTYGNVASITAANRIPAVSLSVKQTTLQAPRRDKTGGRTYAGTPAGARKRTQFELKTYLTTWQGGGAEPAYGALLRASLGAEPAFFAGGTVSAATGGQQITFSAPHGLNAGQAVCFGGEIRFVESTPTATNVILNAPFTINPTGGSPIGGTVTYQPALQQPGVSIFDYWGPAGAVQRILGGGAVDKLKVQINGDYHGFTFTGEAKDLIDNVSFAANQGGLTSFPAEPSLQTFDYSVVPGHLGQAWLGAAPTQFFTVTDAEIALENNLDLRDREFGTSGPTCIAARTREVSVEFSLYERDDNATRALYYAARNRTPLGVMFQLGQQPGQLCGIYMKSVIPEVPEFDDREARLEWRFSSSRAQGTVDDEITIAFG